MGKFIALLLMVAIGVLAYFNVDSENFKTNTVNTLKKEKNINSVFKAREQHHEALRKVLEEL